MKTKQLLKEITLVKRYEAIQQFKQGAFKVLNPAIPQLVKQDVLLAMATLEVLKEIKSIVEEDIKSLKVEDIKVVEILERRYESEIAELVRNKVCPWSISTIEKDYKAIKKGEQIEKVWSRTSRIKELEQLEKTMIEIEESISILADIDYSLVRNQIDELERLRGKKETIDRTLNYKSEEQIKVEIYGCTYNFLNNILEGVQANIEHIEGNL